MSLAWTTASPNQLIRRRFLPISEERFSAVVAAKSKLWEVVGAEEKFDLFLENYVEFERELLNMTLRYAVFNLNEWKEFKASRVGWPLLSACQLAYRHEQATSVLRRLSVQESSGTYFLPAAFIFLR